MKAYKTRDNIGKFIHQFQTKTKVLISKIIVDSWKICMLLPVILWDDGPIFMISSLN